MPGLSNILTTYAGLITAAGFAEMPAGTHVRDTTTQTKKYFQLYLLEGPLPDKVYGGGKTDYVAILALEMHWNPEMDTSIIRTTAADDVETITNTMIKVSNRPSEVLIMTAVPPAGHLDYESKDDWVWHGIFRVDYRLTVDLT